MKAAAVTIGIVLALTGAFILFMPSESAENTDTATLEEQYKPATADELFTLINEERTKAGVPPLTRDARLDQSAQLKADDMRDGGYYGHNNPTTGKKGNSYINDTMPGECSYINENLNQVTGTYVTKEKVVQGWMESDSHRNEMLSPRYTLTGFAVVEPKKGELLAVQHFCDTTWDKSCEDVTSHDYNWQNDVICTNEDGSRFYTSYSGADAFLAQ